MIIELYAAPKAATVSAPPDAPISNPTGELPDNEPALSLGDLLGSFDSRDEALAFLTRQAGERGQQLTSHSSEPYCDYTHVEWLSVTLTEADQQATQASYYLVTDEGY